MACRCAAVDCVALAGGKIVLVRRGRDPEKGKLALPGGFVEPDETIEQACLRELKEETGLDARIVGEIGVFSSPERDPRGTISIALFAIASGKPEPGDDASAVLFLGPDEALRSGLAFDHSEILRAGLEKFKSFFPA